jgi:hypothetical protein
MKFGGSTPVRVEEQRKPDSKLTGARNENPFTRQPIRYLELVLGRRAALPAMADDEQRGQNIAEDNKVNADPHWNVGKNSHALHELTGMRHFLAQWTIRGIFVDRILVARAARLLIGRLHCRSRYKSLGNRHDTDGRRTACRLRNVDVRLNNQNLNRHRNDGQ